MLPIQYLIDGYTESNLRKVINFELVVFWVISPIVVWKIYQKVQKN